MDKISLPFRIVLIVALVFAVVWFLVLRPKPAADVEPAVTPPGVTGLANDVAKANERRRRLERRRRAQRGRGQRRRRLVHHRHHQAFGHERQARRHVRHPDRQAGHRPSRAKPATPVKPAAVAKPAKPGLADDAAPGDPSRPLLASVDAGKVVVVLFWNKNASDDRATRRGLRSIDLHGGKVVASAVPIGDVGRYEAITRGVAGPRVAHRARHRRRRQGPRDHRLHAGQGDRPGRQRHRRQGLRGQEGLPAQGLRRGRRRRLQGLRLRPRAEVRPADHRRGAVQGARRPAPSSSAHSRNRLAKAKATSADERKLKAALVAFADQDIKWVAEARSQLKAGAEPGTVFLTLVQRESDGNDAYVAAAKKLHVRGCYAGA